MKRLAERVAIVTGAGSQGGGGTGTGRAISAAFASEGARLCLVDLHPARAEQTLAEVHDRGGDGFIKQADVSNEDDCRAVVAETVERYGRVDVLVNNAAIIGPVGKIENLAEEDWSRVLAVNLTGAMLMAKHVVPSMIEQGGGAIVNISSTGAFMSTGSTPAYGATKAALIRLTGDLAVAYGRNNIRVNAIAPGNIYTPMVAGMMDAKARAQRAAASALGTEGTAWDVAWAAVFLASDEARWITGATLPVDGGMSQTNPLAIHRTLEALEAEEESS